MPLINLSVRHGQSLEEAQSRLQTAVDKVMSQFGALIRQVVWSTDQDPAADLPETADLRPNKKQESIHRR